MLRKKWKGPIGIVSREIAGTVGLFDTRGTTSSQRKRRNTQAMGCARGWRVGDNAVASEIAGREKGILTPGIQRYYLR